ncbi:MAG TPA: CDP-diacylglycerol--serine O-phosphatidyltransferase [Deltaproteobacteria bacterium]|nr:CDP-diacylglycerol--serine O-phosphatidyltransferase [Deltaproteobacteria bacterium]
MKKRKRKTIYLLPNLLTSASLFCGFYAMVAAVDKRFVHGAIAIFVSAIFDALDGRVARMTGSTSRFGVEYDSLSDVIAFGVAPGLLVYMWALKGYGRFGWLAAFLYVACGALRLARFNIQAETVQKNYFLGLPIPAAASCIAASVLFSAKLGYSAEIRQIAMPIMVYALAFLMVSDIRYFSLKDLTFLKSKPFKSSVAAVLLFVIVLIEPSITLFVATIGYMVSGPVYRLIKGKKALQDEPHPKEGPARQDGRL